MTRPDLAALLRVQERDTGLDRLRYRRSSLPERAAIGACYYADLSHEEAAVALGMPLGTVKTHVLRAKAKLRARLVSRKG